MWTRIAAGGAAVLLLLAGAGCARSEAGAQPRRVTPTATQWPASVAGGACQLLDYDEIDVALGIRFTAAGASRKGDTYTCVVRHSDDSAPYLTLAVTATTADKEIFESTVRPSKATSVKELGRSAYRRTTAASGKNPAAVEVGWLSGDARLLTLRLVFPDDAQQAEVDDAPDGLVKLAKKVDRGSV